MQSTSIIEEQYASNKSELGNLGVKDLFFKYIRFLPVFILSLAFALFGAYIYLRYATPIYRATGTIMIKNNQNAATRGDEKINALISDQGIQNIQNEIEVIKSLPLMMRVVDSLQLQTSYYAVGKIKSPNIYKQGPFLLQIYKINDSSQAFTLNLKFVAEDQFLVNDEKPALRFGEAFKNKYGLFKIIRNSYGSIGKEYNVTWQPKEEIASSLSSTIQVTPKQGTDILIISLEATNAQMAADVVNQLMGEYSQLTREDKNQESAQTLNFINDEVSVIQQQIDSIQKELLNFRIQNNLIDENGQKDNYLNNITQADQEAFEQSKQLNTAQLVEDYLTHSEDEPVPSPFTLADPTLSGMIAQYNIEQMGKKQLLASRALPNNPLVKEKDMTIAKLRQNIMVAIKNLKRSLSSNIGSLRQREGKAEGEIRLMPAKVKELEKIKTTLDSKMSLYKLLIEKREETSISMAASISNSKIINHAAASSSPVKPNKRAIQMLAILIGLGLPAFFIFMMEVINDKINTRYDIEKITQTPVLGEIGHSYADNALVVSKNNRGMVAEQFRIIRSNLQYVLNKIEKPVILVTSSFSGEGKSFVTTNLGAVMALAGKKTIVLEFDIRKPKIMSGLELGKKPGITNFLLGKSSLDTLPVLVPGYDNLYALSSGPVPPNPSELLLEPKVDDIFSYLKQNFDVILIDTAPVGMVSDAMTLSKYANCTLYIVRQGHTYKKQIVLIDEFYREAKLPKVSIVINDIKVKPGYGYYGYGRYGYGYGYTSTYYEEENPPQGIFEKILKWFDFSRLAKKKKNLS